MGLVVVLVLLIALDMVTWLGGHDSLATEEIGGRVHDRGNRSPCLEVVDAPR